MPFTLEEEIPVIRTAGGTTFFDTDAYAAQVTSDPLFQLFRQYKPAQFDSLFQHSLESSNRTPGYLLRPTLDDASSIRYFVMAPRGNIPRLHIRFWYGPFGGPYGYNFDLIDPETKEPIFAPKELIIEYGRWKELLATTEISRRNRGIPPGTSDESRIQEKWQAFL